MSRHFPTPKSFATQCNTRPTMLESFPLCNQCKLMNALGKVFIVIRPRWWLSYSVYIVTTYTCCMDVACNPIIEYDTLLCTDMVLTLITRSQRLLYSNGTSITELGGLPAMETKQSHVRHSYFCSCHCFFFLIVYYKIHNLRRIHLAIIYSYIYLL